MIPLKTQATAMGIALLLFAVPLLAVACADCVTAMCSRDSADGIAPVSVPAPVTQLVATAQELDTGSHEGSHCDVVTSPEPEPTRSQRDDVRLTPNGPQVQDACCFAAVLVEDQPLTTSASVFDGFRGLRLQPEWQLALDWTVGSAEGWSATSSLARLRPKPGDATSAALDAGSARPIFVQNSALLL